MRRNTRDVHANMLQFEKLRYMHRQSSEARFGGVAGTLALEQLP